MSRATRLRSLAARAARLVGLVGLAVLVDLAVDTAAAAWTGGGGPATWVASFVRPPPNYGGMCGTGLAFAMAMRASEPPRPDDLQLAGAWVAGVAVVAFLARRRWSDLGVAERALVGAGPGALAFVYVVAPWSNWIWAPVALACPVAALVGGALAARQPRSGSIPFQSSSTNRST